MTKLKHRDKSKGNGVKVPNLNNGEFEITKFEITNCSKATG